MLPPQPCMDAGLWLRPIAGAAAAKNFAGRAGADVNRSGPSLERVHGWRDRLERYDFRLVERLGD